MDAGRRWTIALVSTARDWGGGEDQALLLAQGLRDRGHRCVVFARHNGALAQRIAGQSFQVHTFPERGRSVAAWRSIRRVLRQLSPDVVHANDAHALWAAGLASLGLRIPLRVAARRVAFPLRSGWLYRWLADAVVCVSLAAAEQCRKAGIPAERIRVVPDGLEPGRVRSGDRVRGRQAVGARDSDRILLTVAKLTDCKGHRYLLEAMPRVLARHPEALCALAGDGELRRQLESLAERLGVAHRVRWLGFRQDVPDLIRAADVFVLPSHTEGLCSTLIEAMLAERPIVATTAGGIPEVLCDQKGGIGATTAWIAPPRNVESLAGAILSALEATPTERAERAAQARRRAEALFTAQRMVTGTLAAYAEFAQALRPALARSAL